jgi:hypothetical protein
MMRDMIKENPEVTIGEYYQTLAEIESVEHKTDSLYLQTTAGIIEKQPGHIPEDPKENIYKKLEIIVNQKAS